MPDHPVRTDWIKDIPSCGCGRPNSIPFQSKQTVQFRNVSTKVICPVWNASISGYPSVFIYLCVGNIVLPNWLRLL